MPLGGRCLPQTPRALLALSLRKLASGLQGTDTIDVMDTESGTALPDQKAAASYRTPKRLRRATFVGGVTFTLAQRPPKG